MTNEEYTTYCEYRNFSETTVGKAFYKFKNAAIRAWVLDTEDSCTDRHRKATKEAHDKANEAEKEFRELLISRMTSSC